MILFMHINDNNARIILNTYIGVLESARLIYIF